MINAIVPSVPVPMILNKDAFKQLFNDQLGTMHCALSHLSLNLTPLAELASFSDLRLAVLENLDDTNNQIDRIEKIAVDFDMLITDKNCLGMKALVQETLEAVSKLEDKSLAADIALIFYLHVIKHIEISAYRTLLITATRLQYDHAKMLLTENMDEEKDNDKLFSLISKQYLLN